MIFGFNIFGFSTFANKAEVVVERSDDPWNLLNRATGNYTNIAKNPGSYTEINQNSGEYTVIPGRGK